MRATTLRAAVIGLGDQITPDLTDKEKQEGKFMLNCSRRSFLSGTALLAGSVALGLRVPGAFASAGMRFDEYRGMDATTLAHMVRAKEVTATELLEIAIARTEAVNPHINAVVLKHYDLARAAVKKATPSGSFGGVPFLLKDLGVSMAGTETTHGSRFFRGQVSETDDPYVEKARDAGLVIFGKTLSPEFGNSPSTEGTLYGATRNPWQRDHSAGGSSGGAAAAVASGIVPVAHASDGGGSIRIPASACGLFGLKPSRGLVPIGPAGSDPRGGLSVQHVISRSVRDSAGMLDVLAQKNLGKAFVVQESQGTYLEQIHREAQPLRIALMRDPLLPIPVDPACHGAVDLVARYCTELGHDVVEAVPGIDIADVMRASGTLSVVSLAERIAAREMELGRAVTADDLEPVNLELLGWGRQVSAEDFTKARQTLDRIAQQMADFMKDYDLILSPTMAQKPAPLGVIDMTLPLEEFGPLATRASTFASLYNATGQPAMTVPLYWSADGLPIGVMFAGRFAEERTLLRLAAQLERAHPWFSRVPAI